MNPFLKLFCFWLLALCCVKEANSYPLDVFSKQQKNFCLLYKLAPTLSNVPYLKNLLGYDTTAPAGEPFAVFVHEENEIETVKYCSSEKISSAIVEECVGHCKGRRRSEAAAVEFSLQAVCKKKSYEDTQLLIVLPSTSVKQLSSCENTSLLISCPTRQQEHCLDVHFREDSNAKPVISSNLYRRSAVLDGHMTSYQGSHNAKSIHRNVALGVVISVVGVALLVLLIALCAGGSQTYDPVQSESGGDVSLKKQSTGEVATPTSSQDATTSVSVSIAMKDEPLSVPKTNGSFSSKEQPRPQQQSQDIPGDSKPENSENSRATKDTSETEDPKTKSLTLSARSYDPLPEVPDEEENKEDDEVAEADYDYARFPEQNVDRMPGSDSEGEEDKEDESDKQQPEAAATSGVLSYGKVSRHSNSGRKKDTENEEYTEVRETFHNTTRTRALTEPIDPASIGVDILRDKRAFTESATHLPLPAIPRSQRMAEQNSKPKIRERLYESVDEMEGNEDMYESVPDDFKKPESPNPFTPNPTSSPYKFPLTSSVSAPFPPSSPIPSRNLDVETGKSVEKKAIEKTHSPGDGEKRRFSFFNRKKTASVSGVKQKKDRELIHHTSSPVTTSTSSPPHISPPPLPNIPAPAPPFNENDEEDTTYDTPQLDLVKRRHISDSEVTSDTSPSKMSIQEAKAKSSSLPMSMRTSGANAFMPRPKIPLPDLPETSGGATATVVHRRVFEDPVDGEQTDPYDMVQILPEPINDDPSYDTVRPEEILEYRQPDNENDADPGYDRVGKLNQGDEQQQPNEGEGGVTAGNMKYAKVTRPASPDDGAKPGVPPEHDEEGYAVVPQEIKMRKRAMSASKGVQQKIQGDHPAAKKDAEQPVKKGGQRKERSTSPEVATIMAEPNEQYAVVDIIAKRKKKQKEKESPFVEIDIIRQSAASPNPPPLPPVGDLGDLTEFDRPPVPLQSEGVHELVDSKHLLLPVAGGVNDPPYAKVMSKTDHPYTELDLAPNKDSGPAKLVKRTDTGDGEYDTVGDVAGKRSSEEDSNLRDKALGYDTVSDGETVRKGKESSIEREMPKLDTAKPQQPMYDVLDPTEDDSPQVGNVYATLECKTSPRNGVSPDDMEEDRYEEIDDDRRLTLITKYQKQSS